MHQPQLASARQVPGRARDPSSLMSLHLDVSGAGVGGDGGGGPSPVDRCKDSELHIMESMALILTRSLVAVPDQPYGKVGGPLAHAE